MRAFRLETGSGRQIFTHTVLSHCPFLCKISILILALVEELPKANTEYNSLEAPKIQINEVFSPGMGLNGFSGFLTDPDTPTKQTSKLLQNHREW